MSTSSDRRGWKRTAGIGRMTSVLIVAHRRDHASRFQGKSDWIRFATLGGILLSFSTLAFAVAISGDPIAREFPGGSAILAGMTIIIFTIKIARRRLYLDWILSGMTVVCVGYAQAILYAHGGQWLLLFCLSLLVSGVSRVWIGLTIPETSGRWLRCSGYVAMIGAGFLFIGSLLELPVQPPSIVAVDLLFHGVAIAGYGRSLLDGRPDS